MSTIKHDADESLGEPSYMPGSSGVYSAAIRPIWKMTATGIVLVRVVPTIEGPNGPDEQESVEHAWHGAEADNRELDDRDRLANAVDVNAPGATVGSPPPRKSLGETIGAAAPSTSSKVPQSLIPPRRP